MRPSSCWAHDLLNYSFGSAVALLSDSLVPFSGQVHRAGPRMDPEVRDVIPPVEVLVKTTPNKKEKVKKRRKHPRKNKIEHLEFFWSSN